MSWKVSYRKIMRVGTARTWESAALHIADYWFKRIKSGSKIATTTSLIVLLVASALVVGCTEVAKPTATAVVFDPTPAPPGTRDLVLAGGSVVDIAALAQPVELPEGDAGNGEALHTSLGCAACHSAGDDVIVGPGWKGLYARAGERTELDAEEYLAQSITKPSKFIVEGFTNVMPAFDYLSDQELADLIAFVEANQ